MVYINLRLRLIDPFDVSIKNDIGFLVLCSNLPGSHVLSPRYRIFVIFSISERFLIFLS